MNGRVVLFVVALLAAAGIYAGSVLPSRERAAAAAGSGADHPSPPPEAPLPPWVLSPGESTRLDAALSSLRSRAPSPMPAGLAERAPGSFAGRVEWNRIQDLFAWAAGQARPVQSLEVEALPDDPSRAACLLVLETEDAK